MELELVRDTFTANSTTGQLFVGGDFNCYILEPPVHDGPKVPGHTAIPEGRYEITLYDSPRLKRKVPLLHLVPGFQFIEIHPGNWPKDTQGCLLPGTHRRADMVEHSLVAMGKLMHLIDYAITVRHEQVWITVRSAKEAI